MVSGSSRRSSGSGGLGVTAVDISEEPPVQSIHALSNPGSDRGGGDHRQWGSGREMPAQGKDFGPPNDRRQGEGRLEHREMIADACSRAATERQILPAVTAFGA